MQQHQRTSSPRPPFPVPLLAWLACGLLGFLTLASPVHAQDGKGPGRTRTVAAFLGGAAAAFLAHEAAHATLDVAFELEPEVVPVDFLGIPFFAISPQVPMTPRQRYAVTASGFWTQHAGSEWILSRDGGRGLHGLRPFERGVLAFDVLVGAGYAGAALLRVGPLERDTRGMALGLGVDERWVGAMLLPPALLDAYRCVRPQARWAKWASRGTKLGLVLLVLR